ncbi:hypothetical protein JZ751_019267 [Albula glossodonta]|uniref:Uncharacterized protein n=1 Tax=Albula glossodonta TaxID=121402 RepID=A0A8T2NYJ0_9TELE|nr:hypothetical protein JZ751_019267 [Albula glossodonta]
MAAQTWKSITQVQEAINLRLSGADGSRSRGGRPADRPGTRQRKPLCMGGGPGEGGKDRSHRKFTGFRRNPTPVDPLQECGCHLLPQQLVPTPSASSSERRCFS